MQTDKTTLLDLGIFNPEEEYSLFNLLNLTQTNNGRQELRKILSTPLESLAEIEGMQITLKLVASKISAHPAAITNGTVIMIERFYETPVDPIPRNASTLTANSYKLLHGPDFSLIKFSIGHCISFIKGMKEIYDLFREAPATSPMSSLMKKIHLILDNLNIQKILNAKNAANLKGGELLQHAYYLKYSFKNNMLALLTYYARLDAWFSLAFSIQKHRLVFPEFTTAPGPEIKITGLFHMLLPVPVAYDMHLERKSNFLFLTGANMAGKSTFIKAVGTAVYLAHLGMAVPAETMSLSMFEGLLSNINVADNIVKGESYFFNEVQRIKNTIDKISDGRRWLILIDELFKGTNVQDAMKCSSAVIEGLLKVNSSAFILSTHLYEIGEALKVHNNIQFNYFETNVHDGQLDFSYVLRPGISNDRLGYVILQREGVVKLLEKL
ncbi:MAG: DNA mismatch repair protein MutS [Ferruginibacter sp.]